MAAKTLYMTNSLVDSWQELSETSPGTDAVTSPNTGWIPGTTADGNQSAFRPATERLQGSFTGTQLPPSTLNTVDHDAVRAGPFTGVFAATDWVFHHVFQAVTSGGDQDGVARMRLWKSANADGSGATELTPARQDGSLITNLSTSASQDSSVTYNFGSITLSNEYLFWQLAWKTSSAGTNSTRDVIFVIGDTGTRIVTPDFSIPASGAPLFDIANF